jgi:hypothetical protein
MLAPEPHCGKRTGAVPAFLLLLGAIFVAHFWNFTDFGLYEDDYLFTLGACRTEKSALPSVRPIFSRLLA